MRYLLLLLSFGAFADGVTYDAKILRVIDGDTVVIATPWLPTPLKPEMSIRVLGVDTPEKGFRAHCDIENNWAQNATEFTTRLVKQSRRQQITIVDWDKYGGRLLGEVILDGTPLSKLLVAAKLARPYHGEKKSDWCNNGTN